MAFKSQKLEEVSIFPPFSETLEAWNSSLNEPRTLIQISKYHSTWAIIISILQRNQFPENYLVEGYTVFKVSEVECRPTSARFLCLCTSPLGHSDFHLIWETHSPRETQTRTHRRSWNIPFDFIGLNKYFPERAAQYQGA